MSESPPPLLTYSQFRPRRFVRVAAVLLWSAAIVTYLVCVHSAYIFFPMINLADPTGARWTVPHPSIISGFRFLLTTQEFCWVFIAIMHVRLLLALSYALAAMRIGAGESAWAAISWFAALAQIFFCLSDFMNGLSSMAFERDLFDPQNLHPVIHAALFAANIMLAAPLLILIPLTREKSMVKFSAAENS